MSRSSHLPRRLVFSDPLFGGWDSGSSEGYGKSRPTKIVELSASERSLGPPGPGHLLAWMSSFPTDSQMSAPRTVSARLARPKLPPILERPRLVDALVRSVPQHPLTVITAGPGYGKSTLLAAFAEQYPQGVVWYGLSPDDGDLPVFLHHLVAGLGRQTFRMGNSLRNMLREDAVTPKSAHAAAGAFLNDVHRVRQPLAIVLDDFHLVNASQPVVDFLGDVLEGLRSELRFVIASRSEPSLPLGRLRVRRQAREFGPEDLAFTRDEVQRLLTDVHGRKPSAEVLEQLAETLGGWVGAMQLLLAMSPGSSLVDLPRAMRRSAQPGSLLHDYLADEVLDQTPPEQRTWMLLSASLDDLDPDILERLLPDMNSEACLDDLLKRRLVTPFLGAEGTVYRYHALLHAFLRRRLRHDVPADQREAFLERAADAFGNRGDLVASARQLVAMENPDRLARFLREHALELLDQGHSHALLGWFESLPLDVLNQEPWLRLRQGDVRHQLGDLPGAEMDYERALDAFRKGAGGDGEPWAITGLGRIWNMRGLADRTSTEGSRALAGIEERLSAGETVDEELVIRLLQVVSGAEFYLGRYTLALDHLDRMESFCRGKPERQAAIWNNRAVVHASRGDFHQAARAFEHCLERPGVRRLPRASVHLSNLALLLDEMGDSERASALFQESLELIELYRNRSHLLYCRVGQARLRYRQGDLDAALTHLREADELNAELKVPLFESDAWALRARILGDRGQYAAARNAVASALAAYGPLGRDANWLQYRMDAAVVELRAGRVKESLGAFVELQPLAEELEALFPRAQLRFFLGEAARRLGEPEAEEHFREALGQAARYGYDATLGAELRRSPDTLAFLVHKGIEPDYVTRLAVGLGPGFESFFLDRLREDPSNGALDLLLDVLSGIGGPAAHRALTPLRTHADPRVAEHARSALAGIESRHPELARQTKPRDGVHVRTLGDFAVEAAGEEIPRAAWKSKRALFIFTYLAIRGPRGATKDRLLELFWAGNDLSRAEKNFHPTLSYVRGALKGTVAGPAVVLEREAYVLSPDLPVTVDTREFEFALSEAKDAPDDATRVAALDHALACYHGDFLEDQSGSWVEETRRRLATLYEEALAQAAEIHIGAGNTSRGLELCRLLLTRDPYREEIHTRMMVCYHHLGDRRAIREQFETLESLLRRELDVEPLPRTRSLFETLMSES